ncbi:hypothetical protein CDL15_Pgr018190 [Punica granatum]|uniref:Thioredoxin domain-containing protein n=1 Tax=Punica granatum TaxID=22663 RepID=A0A218WHK5_PUNGR|nr:hypothetical protein CDL15_Pgr018190 [Punica granatum]
MALRLALSASSIRTQNFMPCSTTQPAASPPSVAAPGPRTDCSSPKYIASVSLNVPSGITRKEIHVARCSVGAAVVAVGQVTEVGKDTFWPIVEAAGEKTVVLDMYTQCWSVPEILMPMYDPSILSIRLQSASIKVLLAAKRSLHSSSCTSTGLVAGHLDSFSLLVWSRNILSFSTSSPFTLTVRLKEGFGFRDPVLPTSSMLDQALKCGPCKIMAPKFQELSEKYLDVVFLKLDCNQENKPLAKELGIRVVPTFKILKEGKIVKEVTGAKFDDLVAAIDAVRSS